MIFKFLLIILFGLNLARLPLSAVESALVPVPEKSSPAFLDDGDLPAFAKALDQSLAYYRGLPEDFSADSIQSLEILKNYLAKKPGAENLNRFVRENFWIYRATPAVTFSAYHEHTLEAVLQPTPEFKYPIYGRPSDLVDAYLEKMDPKKKGERIAGRVEGRELVPYYTREEIDTGKILAHKNLEIAWARDPLEILFLQIQGSGWIRVPGSTETYHIRYAGDNGRPFQSVGLHLIESGAIPKEGFNRVKLAEYMGKLSEAERQKVLNVNPRYIFFEIVSATNSTRGSLLVPLTAGRSVASDPQIYPPGGLAFLRTQMPQFDENGNQSGTKPLSRFVFSQDEGGAIKGPARIDFFAGGGKTAERIAQKLWYPGEFYVFMAKKTRKSK